MSFTPEWLALRERADHAARDEALANRLRGHLAGRRAAAPLRIVDLGCGTGSNLRYLAPRLPTPQHWMLVDNDPAVLRLLPRQAGCEPRELDLARDLERLPLQQAGLVTATALLDLVSEAWVQRLAARVTAAGRARPALLFALSYDGRMTWTPAHPADGAVADAFNRHQRGDKGFGRALGPAAADRTARLLRAAGYEVAQAASDWVLDATAGQPLQRALALGVASAVASAADPAAPAAPAAAPAADWLPFRLAEIDAGRSSLRVGHVDLLALPGR
ncbi:MAG: class I SAM-dependent methyltransferase [Burkholderiaceae bacterium]|nr:class I SAM-dependent methyltransferase [Burkholderiaceae bacterium]